MKKPTCTRPLRAHCVFDNSSSFVVRSSSAAFSLSSLLSFSLSLPWSQSDFSVIQCPKRNVYFVRPSPLYSSSFPPSLLFSSLPPPPFTTPKNHVGGKLATKPDQDILVSFFLFRHSFRSFFPEMRVSPPQPFRFFPGGDVANAISR